MYLKIINWTFICVFKDVLSINNIWIRAKLMNKTSHRNYRIQLFSQFEYYSDINFIFNLLISVAITVMLCQGVSSRSSGLERNKDPFPEQMLNILSRSVCRSTEYLSRYSKSEHYYHPLQSPILLTASKSFLIFTVLNQECFLFK